MDQIHLIMPTNLLFDTRLYMDKANGTTFQELSPQSWVCHNPSAMPLKPHMSSKTLSSLCEVESLMFLSIAMLSLPRMGDDFLGLAGRLSVNLSESSR